MNGSAKSASNTAEDGPSEATPLFGFDEGVEVADVDGDVAGALVVPAGVVVDPAL
jgi:hypothetical protein